MKADKGRPSRARHSETPCISLRGFQTSPCSRRRNPAAGRGRGPAAAIQARRSRRMESLTVAASELPVHTWIQTRIQCWICCQ